MNVGQSELERHRWQLHVRRMQAPTSNKQCTHIGHAIRWHEAEAPFFYIVPAGTPHQKSAGSHHAPHSPFWALGFCERCVDLEDTALLTPFRRVRCGVAPVVQVNSKRTAWVEQLFTELEAECQRTSSESKTLQRALLQLILGEVRRAMGAPVKQYANTLVGQVLEFVWDQALRPISLKDVASHVYRSPKHVATVVKQATGYTVGEWIRSTRIEAAAGWLVHSDDSIEQITERVGWQDTSHFIRQFRHVYGQTPAAWRKQMLAETTSSHTSPQAPAHTSPLGEQ